VEKITGLHPWELGFLSTKGQGLLKAVELLTMKPSAMHTVQKQAKKPFQRGVQFEKIIMSKKGTIEDEDAISCDQEPLVHDLNSLRRSLESGAGPTAAKKKTNRRGYCGLFCPCPDHCIDVLGKCKEDV